MGGEHDIIKQHSKMLKRGEGSVEDCGDRGGWGVPIQSKGKKRGGLRGENKSDDG